MYFSAIDTRIHLLQLKSVNLLSQICRNFIKKEYLKNIATNINFLQKEIQKDINEIFVGEECEKYLDNLIMKNHEDTVITIRQNCLQFYLTAAEEICKRLPVTNDFFLNYKFLEHL